MQKFLRHLFTKSVFLVLGMLLITSAKIQAQSMSGPDTLIVKEMILTTNVADREPVDTVQTFTTSNDQAFCHIRVFNNGEPKQVTFRWLFHGEEYFKFAANIGTSPSWRTYTSVIPKVGDWKVQIVDSSGKVLGEKEFTVSK
ncbi:MAG: DUF2914 domain-containing protein [Candidatus Marinimicrobia bacterium]|nr:DUF2914 domain-containing protein [Candidatus Neomarinimicrobiota bacterium]MCF7828018.1 DUF2914 domain-containing protein [Candidatus Neomarinimicrobiota bacterium]MCF7879227.1 DUF2914 domain-containing protein [Candidatus Neomarinimicrobiota bacterium]